MNKILILALWTKMSVFVYSALVQTELSQQLSEMRFFAGVLGRQAMSGTVVVLSEISWQLLDGMKRHGIPCCFSFDFHGHLLDWIGLKLLYVIYIFIQIIIYELHIPPVITFTECLVSNPCHFIQSGQNNVKRWSCQNTEGRILLSLPVGLSSFT